MTLDFFSALLIGIAGAGHCLAMCGGISSMLTTRSDSEAGHFSRVISYNVGRVASYTLLGAIAGFTGSIAIKSLGAQVIWLKVIAAIFIILLGLYVARIWFVLTHIERLGQYLWRYIQPLARHVLPIKTTWQALMLGAVWGWLPCGLVYSTLTWSLASGSALQGALIMLAFGLGTLPALLVVACSVQWLDKLIRAPLFKQLTGLALVIYGGYSLYIALKQIF
ncbi:sulfite exporter TauE/SafE family protein [Thalassotalea ponticola]|uniref:sulfite exporter TauE/SafE family protein n=1 Tax=Thalassotalea ponticola TaxID=1523392 RepID=UPI0025B55C59|nr:sulfite exporter TauE/SafE family protein [Thalassotalea ponticola]MDN3651224.1 sulfite exporter TauE/SafE family protein [Thalassotalea ponticola]